MKPETAFQIPDICNDCGFTDYCPVEGVCVRAYLRTLGFDTGMPIEDARQIIADHKHSAIIEPPTKEELRGELNAYGIEFDPAIKGGFTGIIGAPIWRDRDYIGIVQGITEMCPGFFEVRAAPSSPADVQAALMARAGLLPDAAWLREARAYCNERVPSPALRKQIRAAIDEISMAQMQIVPALEICGAEVEAVEADRRERTAANVLEALP